VYFKLLIWGLPWAQQFKLAGELGIDNRIMYTVGAAAKKLNLLDSDIIIGFLYLQQAKPILR